MQLKNLRKDSWANSSFAFAAVFILIAVTASCVVSYQCEDAGREIEKAEEEVEKIAEIEKMVSAEARIAVQTAAVQLLGSIAQTFDFEDFKIRFRQIIVRHFLSNYPSKVGDLTVDASVRNITLALSSYNETSRADAAVPGGIVAFLDIDISANSERTDYQDMICVTHEIQTPAPYFANRLEHLGHASNVQGKLGRIVKNVLSQLVQLRVMQGYAAPGYLNGKRIENVLTTTDVERAVNLALILMEIDDFGVASSQSWAELLSHFNDGEQIPIASDWIKSNGDPFKTYAFLEGGTEPDVNLQDFSLQILESFADQLVMSYLEYTEILDIIDLRRDTSKAIAKVWSDLVGYLTGVDSTLQLGQSAGESLLQRTGISDCYLNSVFSDEADLVFDAYPSIVYIFDDDRRLSPVAVGCNGAALDLPKISIMDGDGWRPFGEIISQETLTTGEMIRTIMMAISGELARHIPSISIKCSSDDSCTAMEEILNQIASHLRTIEIDAPLINATYSEINPIDKAYAYLRQFIDAYWESIFPWNETVLTCQVLLSSALADDAIVEDPYSLAEDWKKEIAATILRDLRYDRFEPWGSEIGRTLAEKSNEIKQAILSSLDRAMLNNAYPKSQFGSLAQWVADRVPHEAIKQTLIDRTESLKAQILNYTREFNLHERFPGEQASTFSLLKSNFDGNEAVFGSKYTVAPVLSQCPAYLEKLVVSPYEDLTLNNILPDGKLCICIIDPTFCLDNRVRSVHYTGFNRTTVFPYQTNWLVKARGTVDISVHDAFSTGQSIRDTLLIDLEIPITAVTGWPLERVDYLTSNTLVGDALALLDQVKSYLWTYISPVIEVFKKAFDFLIDALSELSKYILGFAERIGKLLLDFGNWLMKQCTELVDRIRASPMWKYIEIRLELLGKAETRFIYGPVTVIVSCSLPDLLFKKAKDIVRIIVVFSLDKMSIALGFRIAKLSNGLIDIVFNSTIQCSFLKLLVRVDPVMGIRSHLFEMEGFWNDIHLELWCPEINDYKKIAVQLSDIPALGPILTSIPVPALGITISINAGFVMKYRLPICDSLVINEVELNPPKSDSGKEWVELYNPTSSDISVDGYVLETTHGEIVVLELSGTVPSRGYKTFTYPSSSLDNGNSGDSFASGDSVILRDKSGDALDETPMISDVKNDRKSWHRQWDGAPRWEFGDPSKGRSNGNALLHTYPDLMAKLCTDALFYAVKDEMDNVSFSLDFVKNLITSFLRQLIIQTAEFAATLVHEAGLFLDVGINDATGTVGCGVRLKVVVTGEIIRQAILWFAEQLVKLLGSAIWHKTLSPNLLGDAHPMEALFLGADVFFRIGAPKWLKLVMKAASIPADIKLAASFSTNLAIFGSLFGKNWGEYEVNFGIHIDDLPGEDLLNPLKIKRDRVDLWLIKGRLSPM